MAPASIVVAISLKIIQTPRIPLTPNPLTSLLHPLQPSYREKIPPYPPSHNCLLLYPSRRLKHAL